MRAASMHHGRHEREYWQFISKDGASDQCFLFTDAFGRLLQLSLALAAVCVLYIKRKLETPARPLKVWVMDVGKQCVGSLVCHWLNIVSSILFVSNGLPEDDECGIYFATYIVDMTLGLALTIVLLRALQVCAVRFALAHLVDSGYYGEPPQWRIWSMQLAGYMAVLLLMKLATCTFVWAFYRPLAESSRAIFAGFASHRHLELLLVMVVLPGVGNSLQFWILDTYLMCPSDHWRYYEEKGTHGETHWIQPTAPIVSASGGAFGFGGASDVTTEPKLAIPL